MTDRDVSSGDMPNFLRPSRRDAPEIGDASLEALLAGAELPAGSPSQLQPLSEAVAALKAGPASDELAGEAAAMAAFRDRPGALSPAHRSRRRPARRRSLPARAAAAVTVTIAALTFGGLAAAAYAGMLPDVLQNVAHARLGAPAAAARTGHSPTPVGPNATGPDAHGLCNAWAHAKAQGNHKQQAVARRNLAHAAGGADKVAAYCAKVPHPAARGSSTPPAKGKPSTHPTPAGKAEPSTHPTPPGKGKPSTHPTPPGKGKPSTHPTPHAS